MSVKRIRCPECGYELIYATFGARGTYRTASSFAHTCARAGEIQAHDAMTCPVLRAEAERLLQVRFPGRETAKGDGPIP